MKFSIEIKTSVRQLTKTLSIKSKLSFKKKLDLLRKDGCLPKEFSVAGDRLFSFDIDGDWVAIAYRQEYLNVWGSFEFEIEVLDLMPKSKFEQSSNCATPEPILGEAERLKEIGSPIVSLLNNSNMPVLATIIVTGAIGLLALVYKYPGLVGITIKTDGPNVSGEVTIDGR